MTNKAPFCTSLRLTRTVFTRPKTSIISVNPVILSNFASCSSCLSWLKNRYNQRNLRLINDLRLFMALYNCKETFTDVMKTLQIKLFLQNEPKFRKVKLNVNEVLTRDYVQIDTWSIGKNEPKTNPNEPKMNPIKANKMPKQTQNKPNQTQFQSPICPGYLLINPMFQICCVCGLTVSFDSAKMALYQGYWNFNKDGRKKLNLLEYKDLNGPGRMHALTGTLFAHSYLANIVLNN